MKQLIVAPAPHAHSGDSVRKNMLLVILALVPAYVVSVIEFGWGALITAAISVAACVLTEWCISRFLLKEHKQTIGDLSAVLTGLLLAFNLPSSLDWWIVLIGAVVAIGVGKMSFGGLGQNPFNPALVGRVFLLISFPAQMTTWPIANGFATKYIDAETGATPLYYLKHMMKTGDLSVMENLPALKDAFLGAMGGSLGEVCALALIIGGLFLICTKVITWRGVPIIPSDKVEVKGQYLTNRGVGTTEIILVRVGEKEQGVVGLHQAGIPGEIAPSLSARLMGLDQYGVASYLLTKYFSLASLTDDAIAVLENVEVGYYHDYQHRNKIEK